MISNRKHTLKAIDCYKKRFAERNRGYPDALYTIGKLKADNYNHIIIRHRIMIRYFLQLDLAKQVYSNN